MCQLLKDKISTANLVLLKQRVSQDLSLPESWLDANVYQQDWVNLTLMQRVDRVAFALAEVLRGLPYEKVMEKLVQWAEGFEPMMQLIFPQTVWHLGGEQPDKLAESCWALAQLTCFYTSEFAVRQFLQRYPEFMWSQLKRWTHSENEHHRRLASESCRPRLPWASHCELTRLYPEKSLEVIAPLKVDASRYVLKSVANHLNDHWHFNRDWFYRVVQAWSNELFAITEHSDQEVSTHPTYWLLNHALRSGLKAGERQAYACLRYPSVAEVEVALSLPDHIEMGERIFVGLQLTHSLQSALGKLRIELILQVFNGKEIVSRKIWQLKTLQTMDSRMMVSKQIRVQHLKHSPTNALWHRWALQVNGQIKWQQSVTVNE